MINSSTERRTLAQDIEHGAQALNWDQEQLGEIEAEYHGEIARYGDAWPGSCDQIQLLRGQVQETHDAHLANLEWEKKMYGIV